MFEPGTGVLYLTARAKFKHSRTSPILPSKTMTGLITDTRVRDGFLVCTSRIIRNALYGNPKVVYKKLKGKLPLSKQDNDSRLNSAWKQLTAGIQWNDVVLSEEKKFNLNGPDGYKFYCCDLHTEHQSFSKSQFRERFAMVCAALAACGAIEIVFVENRMILVLYQDMLADSLLPVVLLITSRDWAFQQDNTSVLDEVELGKIFSIANLESRPKSN
ncbi:hypothetical protein AVEN_85131-1 [Araneus ventricosus]|uniref:Uncharacterized protein n=1 Tax=Araneus ventricosus TaxID=182803 RepID=A0A4Y2M6F5_ARAVE|nr:hypothetical protein AVEN_85131-1 [Araneus ventricosus]